jgi:hypothetical protein
LLIEPHSMWMGFQLLGVSSPRSVSRVLSMTNEIPKHDMSVRCDWRQSLCFSLCLCFGLGFLLQLHVSSFHNTKEINITTWQHWHRLICESIMQCDYEYQVNSIKRFASLGHSINSLFTSISWTPKVNHVPSLLIQTLHYILIQALLESTIYPMFMYKSKLSFILFEA